MEIVMVLAQKRNRDWLFVAIDFIHRFLFFHFKSVNKVDDNKQPATDNEQQNFYTV